MWKTAIVCSIIMTALSVIRAERVRYDNYKVYRLYVTTLNQLQFLATLRDNPHIDFWSRLRPGTDRVDVMVAPTFQPTFLSLIKEKQIRNEIIIHDFERIIEEERDHKIRSSSTISFTEYSSLHEINRYLTALAGRFPNKVSLAAIGLSYENRILTVCQISSNRTAKKPVIFIDAGIHAREWIAPSMALYIINQLVENPQNNHLLDKVDWHILPLMNPDGYEYSRRTDRMWRKTRSRRGSCYGTDANRNFDFHWGEHRASPNPCSQIFKGPFAFSENETRSVSYYLNEWNHRTKLYVSLHSYGNYMLYPWGYTLEPPDNAKEHHQLGKAVNSAINQKGGRNYKIGSAASTLYLSSGLSADWAKGVAKIQLSYGIELPRGGNKGFDPPVDRILPILKETFHGIVAFGKYVEKKFGK